MDSKVIGENLRRLRESRALTQSQVADSAGISRITYRNIESGESIPKVSTLQSIASGTGVKLQDLLVPVRTLKKVRFRASKKMNNRDKILTEVAGWLDDFNFLEKRLHDRRQYPFNGLPLDATNDSRSRAISAAAVARKKLGLSETMPIRDIAGLFESHGIKIYPIRIASDGFFGLSVASEEGGPAIVVNVWDRISVERWIFSAAHELGHLLLHLDAFNVEEIVEDNRQEEEANIFASHFLMPEHTFMKEWNNASGLSFVDRVFKVKRIFQVSYKSVLYRLVESLGKSIWARFQSDYRLRTGKTLSIVDEPEALTPNKFYELPELPEILRSQEPDSLSSSYFVEGRLSKLVRNAIEKEQITMSRGAEILRVDLEEMRQKVSSWV
jgi:Zn-dependent peptidase ImmA (M78 family)/DNA-binding XRE family transcriptional regulator